MKFLYINFVISLWVTAITTFSMGIFVLLRSRRNIVNKTFAFYSFAISWWSFCQIWLIACDKKLTALIWTRIEQVGVFFIPTFFVHFVMSLLNIKVKKQFLLIFYSLSIIFAFLCVTPLMMADAIPKLNVPYVKYFATPGSAYHFAILFFAILVTYGLGNLFSSYRLATGARQNQLKYLFWSSLLGYIGGGANFLLVYGISVPFLNPFGTYALPVYIIVVAYAILRYQLMDINLALTRAGIFVIVYLLVLGIPLGLTAWGKSWLQGLFGTGWYWAPVVLAIILATLGPSIYLFLQRRAEARLLAKKRARQDELRDLSSFMMRFNRLSLLASLIVHNVVKILQLRHSALYLLEPDPNKTKQFNLICSYGVPQKVALPLSLALDSAIAKELDSQKLAIEHERLKHEVSQNTNHNFIQLQEDLSELKAHIIIPAFLRFRLMGFVILGESRENESFTQEDINVLQVLSNQAALAIENALFWSREEEKIVESSKEEAASAVSFGAGHQFNNRLYAISMAVDGIFDTLGGRDVKELSAEESKQILEKTLPKLKKISEECQYGGQITAGIMSLTGSTPPNFAEFDPCPIITSSLELVEMKHAQDRTEDNRPIVEISCSLEKNLPMIFGSNAQIRDCVFNLVDNAYDAVYEKIDQIKVKNPELNWPQNQPYLPHIEVKASIKDNYLVITITDNGIGIKEEDKKRIFAGYFSNKPADVKGFGRGGHGIGLFVVRKFILAHKGKINFTSQYGQGTTFTMELPLSKAKEGKKDA